jgi:hypothetical protein
VWRVRHFFTRDKVRGVFEAVKAETRVEWRRTGLFSWSSNYPAVFMFSAEVAKYEFVGVLNGYVTPPCHEEDETL